MTDLSIRGAYAGDWQEATAIRLQRLRRRLQALRRRARRHRFVARMRAEREHMLADLGIDPRRTRRYDWLSALMQRH